MNDNETKTVQIHHNASSSSIIEEKCAGVLDQQAVFRLYWLIPNTEAYINAINSLLPMLNTCSDADVCRLGKTQLMSFIKTFLIDKNFRLFLLVQNQSLNMFYFIFIYYLIGVEKLLKDFIARCIDVINIGNLVLMPALYTLQTLL